jgi:hypothetical protein
MFARCVSLAFAGNKGGTPTSTSSIDIEECSELWLGGIWFRDVSHWPGLVRVSDGSSLVVTKGPQWRRDGRVASSPVECCRRRIVCDRPLLTKGTGCGDRKAYDGCNDYADAARKPITERVSSIYAIGGSLTKGSAGRPGPVLPDL